MGMKSKYLLLVVYSAKTIEITGASASNEALRSQPPTCDPTRPSRGSMFSEILISDTELYHDVAVGIYDSITIQNISYLT